MLTVGHDSWRPRFSLETFPAPEVGAPGGMSVAPPFVGKNLPTGSGSGGGESASDLAMAGSAAAAAIAGGAGMMQPFLGSAVPGAPPAVSHPRTDASSAPTMSPDVLGGTSYGPTGEPPDPRVYQLQKALQDALDQSEAWRKSSEEYQQYLQAMRKERDTWKRRAQDLEALVASVPGLVGLPPAAKPTEGGVPGWVWIVAAAGGLYLLMRRNQGA